MADLTAPELAMYWTHYG